MAEWLLYIVGGALASIMFGAAAVVVAKGRNSALTKGRKRRVIFLGCAAGLGLLALSAIGHSGDALPVSLLCWLHTLIVCSQSLSKGVGGTQSEAQPAPFSLLDRRQGADRRDKSRVVAQSKTETMLEQKSVLASVGLDKPTSNSEILAKRDELVELKKNVGVRVYHESDCKGQPEIVSTMSKEPRCKSCFDLCGKHWTNGHHRKDLLGTVKSIEVFGQPPASWKLQLNENCVGTYSYSGNGAANFLEGLSPADGCVNLKQNIGEHSWSCACSVAWSCACSVAWCCACSVA